MLQELERPLQEGLPLPPQHPHYGLQQQQGRRKDSVVVSLRYTPLGLPVAPPSHSKQHQRGALAFNHPYPHATPAPHSTSRPQLPPGSAASTVEPSTAFAGFGSVMGSPMAITPSPLQDVSDGDPRPSDTGSRGDLVVDATMVDGQEFAFTSQARQAGFGDPLSGSIQQRCASFHRESSLAKRTDEDVTPPLLIIIHPRSMHYNKSSICVSAYFAL